MYQGANGLQKNSILGSMSPSHEGAFRPRRRPSVNAVLCLVGSVATYLSANEPACDHRNRKLQRRALTSWSFQAPRLNAANMVCSTARPRCQVTVPHTQRVINHSSPPTNKFGSLLITRASLRRRRCNDVLRAEKAVAAHGHSSSWDYVP